MRRISVFLSMLALAGCVAAPVTQTYPGPTLASSQHVLVQANLRGRAFASQRVDIEQVDDKPTLSTGEGIFSSASGASAVYVLPGKHYYRMRYRRHGTAVTANLWLVGEAGGSYLARVEEMGDGVRIWIEDEKTGKPAGGVRGSADEPK